MRTYLQWSLVILIAVGLIAVLAHQVLTATTGRARDASVASLEKKLARLEVERTVSIDSAGSARDPSNVQLVGQPPIATTHELRTRWRDLFESLPLAHSHCSIEDDTLRTLQFIRLGVPERPLTEDEREQVAAYVSCMADVFAELAALCNYPGDLRGLFDDTFGPLTLEFLEGCRWTEWILHVRLAIQMGTADHAGAIDSLCLLMRVTPYGIYAENVGEPVDDRWWWEPIRAALAEGNIGTSQWERLLQQLGRRSQPLLLQRDIEALSRSMISHYEHWPESLSMQFSDSPVHYTQNWAYKRITTPLFNYDLARFSEAMNTLVDLAEKPYYLAKPGLESFYDTFDVERGIEDTKFLRQNPAWRSVIEVSRDRFVRAAYSQATTDVARVAILLEQHRRKTGAYPDSLDALTEHSGVAIPLNPLDGQPYLYERHETEFVLGFRQPANSALHSEERLNVAAFWDDPEYELYSRFLVEQLGGE